jgi:TetR/AcrR family transcriptional regulator of autoinduction and epiphytic fitness
VVSATADGRVQRGARTRAAIVDALLALLEQDHGPPTAREVADAAGVSLRSVFQHFPDMESLYGACVERQFVRLAELRVPLDPSASRADRVGAFVAQRARIYERIAPARRAALMLATSSPVVRAGLTDAAAEHRRVVAASFAPELGGGDRRERLAAIEVATSFDTWDHLRRVQRCSAAVSERVVVRLTYGALEGEG